MLSRRLLTSAAATSTLFTARRGLNTNDLCDKYWTEPAGKDGFCVVDAGLRLQHYGGTRAFSGPAVTVKCFEDNTCVKKLAGTPGEGRVIWFYRGRCVEGEHARSEASQGHCGEGEAQLRALRDRRRLHGPPSELGRYRGLGRAQYSTKKPTGSEPGSREPYEGGEE